MASIVRKVTVYSTVGTLLLVLTACDRAKEQIKKAINEKWPPISAFDRQSQALAASDNTLQSLTPVVYLSLDRRSLDRIPGIVESQLELAKVKNPKQLLPKVTNLKLKTDHEVVSIVCDFVLEIPDPAVVLSGKLDGQATFAARGTVLQPAIAFNQVVVDDLKWKSSPVAMDVAVPAINAVLRSAIDNINGAVHLEPISLAIGPIAPLDPRTIKAQGLTLSGSKIDMPTPIVSGVAILEADDKLQVMADLRLPGELPAPPAGSQVAAAKTTSAFNDEFKSFQSHFESLRDQSFGKESGGTKAAVSRAFIATVLNTTINNKALHLEYAFPQQSQPFDADIRPYDSPHINCDSQEDQRNCHPANACSLGHDERSCGHDYDVGGWHFVRGHVNDPVCEGLKAGQNQAYLLSFNACNAAYTASIPVCEAEKASQNAIYAAKKAACEVDKARLQEIEKLAHVGHISGSFSAAGNAAADIYNFGAGSSLETISMNTAIAGSANVVARVKFDPDTAGRLACIVGWTKDLSTSVSLRQQAFPIRGIITAGDDGTILVALKGSQVSIQLDPAPVQAIFVAHPELVVVCSPLVNNALVPALAYRALQQGDIPSEISGRYNITIPDSKFSIPLQTLSIKAGADEIKLKPKLAGKAAWFIEQ